ncbi:MAG TPA: HPr family phosphocarrier protein [Methylomusa anaerophila]|uniref:Phosphocarrier protein HPr n=1 Tax=Methylomusa anaerophila TaxID=1930071 RepID=A0A348AM84_9FIRM|nr:HPr family phosphocarrier protein [Methylomusa anaerophila]BBB92182.1 phosphocarrier protein HPr [Methylomusa anaerophila]HML87804.1 HPr family phosphocarrier protein [Methylomusa anaerophila]
MYTKIVTISNKTGLHARPASSFVQTAAKFQSEIRVQKEDNIADAKSILKLMALGITKGTEIAIAAEGPDEKAAVEALVELIESNFGE